MDEAMTVIKESKNPIQESNNPWDVDSIYDFNFFCCPECDGKSRNKQDFIDHASANHPQVSFFVTRFN